MAEQFTPEPTRVSRPDLSRRSLAVAGLAGAALVAGAAPAQAHGKGGGRNRTCIDDALLVPPPIPEVAEQAEMVGRLAYMVGCWKGSGWVIAADGRTDIEQTERVRQTLSGEVMVIDGRSIVPGKSHEPVFSAFAVLRYDPATGYRWRAASQGGETETAMVVTDDGWYWDLEAGPGAVIRYQSWFTRNTWHETGVLTTPAGQETIMDFTVKRCRNCR